MWYRIGQRSALRTAVCVVVWGGAGGQGGISTLAALGPYPRVLEVGRRAWMPLYPASP